MTQDTEVYGNNLSDTIPADSFFHSPPSFFGSTDPELLSFMEELPTYELEDRDFTQGMLPAQDPYYFNPDPLFNLEQELMWGRFGDPSFPDSEFTFNSTSGYSTEPYTQEIASQVSGATLSSTSFSQNSLSPDCSPDTSESQGEVVVVGERSGKKRRKLGQNESAEGDTSQILRKRVRSHQNSQPIPRSINYVDRGYESMSPQTTLSSPQSDTGSARKQREDPEVVGNVARAIDGMIDKFSQSQVKLAKEEIEALQTAGLPIPTTLPLTKVEQHALRDVRRKLKNKQAAMENRRRKKEYVSDLEKKLVDYEKMVSSFEERMSRMEREKQVLETELKRLKRAGKREKENRPVSVQTGACLMVFILCFGLVFGTWCTGFGPLDGHSLAQKSPNSPFYAAYISRTLQGGEDSPQSTTLSLITELLFQTGADLLSLFNFTSDSTYFLINEESLLCQNHSCAPH